MATASLRRLTARRPYVCHSCTLQACRRGLATVVESHDERPRPTANVLEVLESRGYIKDIAGNRDDLNGRLLNAKVGVYAGIDPTAPSLHLGHLLPLMVLFWLYHHGHHTVSLVGGATARVGDPSGRLTSRESTAESVKTSNFESLYKQVGKVWETASKYGQRHGYQPQECGTRQLLNNADWLQKLNIMSFFETIGSCMRIGTMLGRDTVKNKLEKGDGMSFAEFTYPLLQAWDWWHMYKEHDVQLQIGGSDQYGNIVAGIDAIKFIKRSKGRERQATTPSRDSPSRSTYGDGKLLPHLMPMGITVPLLTTAGGEKFGKSAGNAIWLDKTMTSPFDLYGFLLRSSDADVGRYLKLFTFVPLETIEETLKKHKQDPSNRLAQHLLASEVLELVHGAEEASKTRAEHEAMRNPFSRLINMSKPSTASDGLSASPLPSDDMTERIMLPWSLVIGVPFTQVLWHAGLAATKSEAARLVKSGGVYIASGSMSDNEDWSTSTAFVPVNQRDQEDASGSVISSSLFFRLGKWKIRPVEVVDDEVFVERGGKLPTGSGQRCQLPGSASNIDEGKS